MIGNSKKKELQKKKNELVKRINLAQGYRQELISKTQDLAQQLSAQQIDKTTHDSQLSQILGDKSFEGWMSYYDQYLGTCRSQLYSCEKLIRKETVKHNVKLFAPAIIIGILVITTIVYYSFFAQQIQLAPEFEEKLVTVKIGESFDSNGLYSLVVEEEIELIDARITGNLIVGGEGGTISINFVHKETGEEVLLYVNEFATEISLSPEIAQKEESDGSGEQRVDGLEGESAEEVTTNSGEEVSGEEKEESAETAESGEQRVDETTSGEKEEGETEEVEEKEETEITITREESFIAECAKTCDLSEFDFSSGEYELKIEVSGDVIVNLDELVIAGLVQNEVEEEPIEENPEETIEEPEIEVIDSEEKGTLYQLPAVINQPVQWVRVIENVEDADKVELPEGAYDIEVKLDSEVDEVLEIVEDESVSEGITGNAIKDVRNTGGVFSGILRSVGVTGNAIKESGLDRYINDRSGSEKKDLAIGEVAKDEVAQKVAVVYTTPGATSREENVNNGKRLIVESNEKIDSLTIYTQITGPTENLRVEQNGRDVNFDVLDTDGDGENDLITWEASVEEGESLVFLIIIDIVKASLLNEDREFVADIFAEVSELDDRYAEILDGQYARVRFEEELQSFNDITIYVGAGSNYEGAEVYEFESDQILAVFETLIEGHNQIFLDNLENPQDTFDIKFIGNGFVDRIIDPTPTSAPLSCNVHLSAAGGTCTGSGELGNATFNSCADVSPISLVNNIYINESDLYPGDVLNVTCDVSCGFLQPSEIAISYFNSPTDTGTQILAPVTCSASTNVNVSTEITLDNVVGQHYVRCSAAWQIGNIGTNVCSTTVVDHDDMNVTVSGGISSCGANLTSENGYYYLTNDLNATEFEDCVNILASNVTVDGRGFEIFSETISTQFIGSSAIQSDDACDFNFTIMNVVADSEFLNYSFRKRWDSGASVCGRGGADVIIINSSLRNIRNSAGTPGVSSFTNTSGGNLTLINSTADLVLNNGASTTGSGRQGGTGGVLELHDSHVYEYIAAGGNHGQSGPPVVAGHAGNASLYGNSSLKKANLTGGSASGGSPRAGHGGNIYMDIESINATGIEYRLNHGTGSGGVGGTTFIRYDSIIEDLDSDIFDTTLHLVNKNNGEIKWEDEGSRWFKIFDRTEIQYNSIGGLSPGGNPQRGPANVTFYNLPGGIDLSMLENGGFCGFPSNCENLTTLDTDNVTIHVDQFSGSLWVNYSIEDVTPPLVTSIYPFQDSVINFEDTLVANQFITDAYVPINDIASFSFTVNDGLTNHTMIHDSGSGPYRFRNQTHVPWPTVLYPGNKTLRIYATDLVGNNNFSESVTLFVESPTVFSCREFPFPNTVYTLTQDIDAEGDCLRITADNVTINGNGFSINGNGSGDGVVFSGAVEGGMSNIFLTEFERGLVISQSDNLTMRDFAASSVGTGVFTNEGQGLMFINYTANDSTIFGFDQSFNGQNITLINSSLSSSQESDFSTLLSLQGASFIDTYIETFEGDVDPPLVFENTSAGIIHMNDLFTLPDSNGANLSEDIVIINNSVFIDEASLDAASIESTITLYNVPTDYADPTILRDGIDCLAPDCVPITSLSAGTVMFNVTGGGEYTIADSVGLFGCQAITVPDSEYFLANNILGPEFDEDCFVITADNVTVHGQDFSFTASNATAAAFRVIGADDVRIYNFTQTAGGYSVILEDSNNAEIHDIDSFGPVFDVIRLVNSDNNTIYDIETLFPGNTFFNLSQGSDNNNISLSTGFVSGVTTYMVHGILVDQSSNNTFHELNITRSIGNALVVREGSHNLFIDVLLNDTLGNAIQIEGASTNNTFIRPDVISTAGTVYDFRIATAGTIDTRFVDIASLGEYELTGIGGSVTVENSDGIIKFTEPISGTGINFSEDIIISPNFVSVNDDAVPGLNANATVTMFDKPGDGMSDPRIVRDDVIECRGCTNYTDLTASTVVFDVPHWSNYSIKDLTSFTFCADLNDPGIYNLLNNISISDPLDCMHIRTSNVRLNGNGFYINGSNGFPDINDSGIDVGSLGVGSEVINLNIENFGIGAQIDATDFLMENLLFRNNSVGVNIGLVSNAHIKDSVIEEHLLGVYVSGSNAQNLTLENVSFEQNPSVLSDLRNDVDGQSVVLLDTSVGKYQFAIGGVGLSVINSGVGRIDFNEFVTGTGNNLSSDIRIRLNNAYVNSTMSGLNVSANVSFLSLASLALTDPRIIRDRELCPPEICTNLTSLSAKNVAFNVTGWSEYFLSNFPPFDINFVSPTLPNNSFIATTSYNYNVSITAEDLEEVTHILNGVNTTLYNESLVLALNLNNNSLIGENDTFAIDSSMYANNVTGNSGAEFVTNGRYGGGFYFDGSGDFLEVPNDDSLAILQEDMTLSTWVNFAEDTAQWQMLITRGDGTDVNYDWHCNGIGGSSECRFVRSDGAGNYAEVRMPVDIELNEWTHLTVVQRENNVSYYKNGIYQNEANLSLQGGSTYFFDNILTDTGDPVLLGVRGPGEDFPLNGTLDEPRIWNKALSHEEVFVDFMSNLYMESNTSWVFEVNQTNLSATTYTYHVWADPFLGPGNTTDERTITVDLSFPLISFENPTPPNATVTTNQTIPISVHVNESSLNEFIFNWDGENFSFFDESLILMLGLNKLDSLGELEFAALNDSSIYGNDAYSVGARSTPDGKYGGAYTFDGDNDRVVVEHSPEMLIQNGSVELWFKSNSSNSTIGQGLFTKDSSGLDSGGHLAILYNDPGPLIICPEFGLVLARIQNVSGDDGVLCSSNGSVRHNEWNHVVVTFGDEGFKLYLNGILEDSDPITYGLINSSGGGNEEPIVIGANSWGSNNFSVGPIQDTLNGSIDEVRMWNRALSASEVEQHYMSNLAKLSPENWVYYVNQSKSPTEELDFGVYLYQAFASDSVGNANMTDERTIIINDTMAPEISFVNPTPADGVAQLETDIYVNVSSYDNTAEHYTLLDFDNTLMLFMRMDDINLGGELVDLSSYSRNGTLEGGVEIGLENGYWGAGSRHQNEGDYIHVPHTLFDPSESNFSAFAWANFTPYSNFQILLQQRDGTGTGGAWLALNPNANLVTYLHEPAGAPLEYTDVEYNDSQWHHFGITYNGTSRGLWVDGILVAADDETSIRSSDGTFQIGESIGLDEPLRGMIDEVVVFNRTLTTQEIGSLYDANAVQYSNNFSNQSAGYHNFTGYSADKLGNLNQTETRVIRVGNDVPQIIDISVIDDVILFPGNSIGVEFSVLVQDLDDETNLDVNATFFRDGEINRSTALCNYVDSPSTNVGNYSCSVDMWYFDGNGTWNVSVSAEDDAGEFADFYTEEFLVNILISAVVSPSGMSWSTLDASASNVLADERMIVNNTGNVNLSINITGRDLLGVSDNSYSIPSRNFSVSVENSCVSGISTLPHGVNVSVSGVNLPRGDNSLNLFNEFSGQEELYYCLLDLPEGLLAQDYSASGANGAWEIHFFEPETGLLYVALALGAARRRKRKEDDGLNSEISEKLEELLLLLREQRTGGTGLKVPVSIFTQGVAPAEALIKYLRENEGLTFSEIASMINRDQRTIWVSYSNSVKKRKKRFSVGKNDKVVSLRIFSDRKLSILESLVVRLKEEGLRNNQIAELLGKDQKNIWTVYSRANKKLVAN